MERGRMERRAGRKEIRKRLAGRRTGRRERERDGGWQFPVITANPYFIA